MGCCGSRDGCLGDREQEARELYESIKKRLKKSRAFSHNEVGYPEKQDRRWDSNLSQDFAEGNRTQSPDCIRYDPYQLGELRKSDRDGNLNSTIISENLEESLKENRNGTFAANHYKGTVFEKACDEDSAEEKEMELYLEINLTHGRIVGYQKIKGTSEIKGEFNDETKEFKVEISQIKSKEIFEGKFTQKDYSQLEGYLYVPEFEDKEDGKIVKLTAVNK